MNENVNSADLHVSLNEAETVSLHGVGLAIGSGEAPEWIHLLPAGKGETVDRRGPFMAPDLAAIVKNSMGRSGKLVIDINHATDRLAPQGKEAPAYGWIVELQSRTDGIWGRVEWTAKGRELVAGKHYRFISPALGLDAKKNVVAILRASLVNNPNLVGLTSLNSEENVDKFLENLRKALNLEESADEAAILTAATSLQSATQTIDLKPVAKALGLKDGATIVELQSAATELTAKVKAADDAAKARPATGALDKDALIVELQSAVKDQATQIAELQGGNQRRLAEEFVDQAIRDGRVGVKSQRDAYIELHMENPDRAKTLIEGMPKLMGNSETRLAPPKPAEGEISLNDADTEVARLMGLEPKYMAEIRAKDGANREAIL